MANCNISIGDIVRVREDVIVGTSIIPPEFLNTIGEVVWVNPKFPGEDPFTYPIEVAFKHTDRIKCFHPDELELLYTI